MADIYVDYSTGNDSTGDGSVGNPYQTIATAYTNATTGDNVYLSDSAGHPVTTSIDFSVKNLTFLDWNVATPTLSDARIERLK